MVGYDPDFIGIHVPLPGFQPSLIGDVLRSDRLRDDVFADYLNYTVVTSARLRSPIYAALNIDQTRLHSVPRRRRWDLDTRIGDAYQLDNDYYYDNRWDRGHMARRASASWGASKNDARKASDDTFYYSNAALQWDVLNQDEWLGLEDWVRTLDDDANNRISEISGPIYQGDNRHVTPGRRPPAPIPSAFFKVIYFRHRDAPDKLSVRAFYMPQDAETMRDRSGWRLQNLQRYQVSVREIEELTGLDFPEAVGAANPIYFTDSPEAREHGVVRFPEVNEVDIAEDIIDPGQQRMALAGPDTGVFILAAMVNPEGDEREGEWISIANLSDEPIDMAGWTLRDTLGREHAIDGVAGPGEAIRIQPVGAIRLANGKAGSISLFDANGARVQRVFYTGEESKSEGRPVVFLTPGRFNLNAPEPEPNEDR